MPAELVSHADPGSESVHGSVVASVWAALTRSPTLEGHWKLRVFCDHPPQVRVVMVSPEGLTRHWQFDRADNGMLEAIERGVGDWIDAGL